MTMGKRIGWPSMIGAAARGRSRFTPTETATPKPLLDQSRLGRPEVGTRAAAFRERALASTGRGRHGRTR